MRNCGVHLRRYFWEEGMKDKKIELKEGLLMTGWEILSAYPYAKRTILCKYIAGRFIYCDLWHGQMQMITKEKVEEIEKGNW